VKRRRENGLTPIRTGTETGTRCTDVTRGRIARRHRRIAFEQRFRELALRRVPGLGPVHGLSSHQTAIIEEDPLQPDAELIRCGTDEALKRLLRIEKGGTSGVMEQVGREQVVLVRFFAA
jgi:hypothetical protein